MIALGHATFTTPDLETAGATTTADVLGLSVTERDKDRAFLASSRGSRRSNWRRATRPELTRLSFQVAPDTDFNDVVKELSKHGIKSEQRNGISPGVAEAVTLHRPQGHADRALCRIQVRQGRRQAAVLQRRSSSATSPIACSTCRRS